MANSKRQESESEPTSKPLECKAYVKDGLLILDGPGAEEVRRWLEAEKQKWRDHEDYERKQSFSVMLKALGVLGAVLLLMWFSVKGCR